MKSKEEPFKKGAEEDGGCRKPEFTFVLFSSANPGVSVSGG